MMMFDDDDDEEEFSLEDFSEGDNESAEPPAPEPLGEEELPLKNAEPAPQSNDDTWTCSCGQENVGEFCVACGKPKSESAPRSNEDTWTCSCGQENIGEFCVACGKPKSEDAPQPNGDTWLCSCGQENVGDFCVTCGNPKSESAPQSNADTWTCSCGQENVGGFCVACGKPKSESAPQSNADTWTCSCGQENVGGFCVACGNPKSESAPQPNGDTWLCSCGQENVGEFCGACGKPKNPSGNSQAEHSRARRNPLSPSRPNLQPQPPLQSLTQSPPINSAPPPADSSTPPQFSSGSNKAVIIGAIVGALLLAGGGFFAWQNSQDDNRTLGSASSSTDNKPPENTTVIATYYVVNCNQSVTLRRMPSTESVELAQVPLGQAVGFIEETGNGFCKVNHAGKVGYILSQYLSAEKPAPVTNPPVQNAQPANNNSSLSLGGLNLGDSADKMHQILGREDRITPSDNPNHRHAEYRNIVITLNGNYIDGLVSYSSAVQTEKGIREGASLQAVISAYGRRCSVQTYEDLTLYEYPYDTPQGFIVMRFAVKNGVVNYISLRYVRDAVERQKILSTMKTL